MTRTKRAAETAARHDDQAAEPVTIPADLGAAAELHNRDAALARDQAARRRANAQSALAEAERQAAQILAAAQSAVAGITAEADTADQRAAQMETTARQFAATAAVRDQAEALDQQAAALEVERAEVATKIEGLEDTLARLRADREEASAALAAARQATDPDAVSASRSRIAGIDDLAPGITAALTAAQARVAAIGDADAGEVADTLAAARSHRGGAWLVLCELAGAEDAHPAVLLARDAEAARAAAASDREAACLAVLAPQVRAAQESAEAVLAELTARRTVLRSIDSGIELAKRIDHAERFAARAPQLLAGLAACTARLADADPATLDTALTAARHCRAEVRRLLSSVPAPAGEDDPGTVAEIAASLAEAARSMVQEPSPAARRQSVVTLRG